MVSILVYSDDPRASAYYNLPAATTVASTSSLISSDQGSSAGPSYLVDEAGNIQFPGLGNLTIAGLRRTNSMSSSNQNSRTNYLIPILLYDSPAIRSP
jgi:polysaccharide export outer membrane protein